MKADTELRCIAVAPVVLQEASAHVTGRHPNDRVLASIVGGEAVKELYANSSLLQLIDGAIENSFDNKPEELLTAVASFERGTLSQIVEVPSEGFNFLFVLFQVGKCSGPDTDVHAR